MTRQPLGDLINEAEELEMQHHNTSSTDEELLIDNAPITPPPTLCQAFCCQVFEMIRVLGVVLCLVFRVMIVVTVMYFHTTTEKIIGVCMGVVLFMAVPYLTS